MIQPVLWGGAGAVPVGDAEPVLVDEVHVVGSGADGLSGGMGCQMFGSGWLGKGLAWVPEVPSEGAGSVSSLSHKPSSVAALGGLKSLHHSHVTPQYSPP